MPHAIAGGWPTLGGKLGCRADGCAVESVVSVPQEEWGHTYILDNVKCVGVTPLTLGLQSFIRKHAHPYGLDPPTSP